MISVSVPHDMSGGESGGVKGVVGSKTLVTFRAAGLRFGLPVEAVRRVISAFQISPLPGTAPAIVGGLIRAEGELMPVIDPHKLLLGGAPTHLSLHSRFIITKTPTRLVAIVADAVDGVREMPTETFRRAEQLTSNVVLLKEIGATEGDLIYVYNPDGFLAEEDEAALAAAMRELSQ